MANLPLSIRVQTTLLASMCRVMPFSARALKTFFDVDIPVENKLRCGLAWSVILSITIRVITVVDPGGAAERVGLDKTVSADNGRLNDISICESVFPLWDTALHVTTAHYSAVVVVVASATAAAAAVATYCTCCSC